MRGADAAFAMLASRDDPVSLAAAASAMDSVGLPTPPASVPAVRDARRNLGIPPQDRGLNEIIRLADAGRWKNVEQATASFDESALDGAARMRVVSLAAESMWRLGRRQAALEKIGNHPETVDIQPVQRRSLIVLRGDIRSTLGRMDDACRDYRAATDIYPTPHVSLQLMQCEPVTASLEADRP
jgi:hypothetical protein